MEEVPRVEKAVDHEASSRAATCAITAEEMHIADLVIHIQDAIFCMIILYMGSGRPSLHTCCTLEIRFVYDLKQTIPERIKSMSAEEWLAAGSIRLMTPSGGVSCTRS